MMNSIRNTGRLLAVLAACLGFACAGCSGDSEPPAGSSAAREQVAVTPEPLWIGTTGRPNEMPGIDILGQSVVTAGNTRDELSRALFVADAETGRPRWRLDEAKPLPGDDAALLGPFRGGRVATAGSRDDWTVFVPYRTEPGSFGVAALAGADGAARWKTDVAGRSLDPGTHEVLAASDRVVVSGAESKGTTRLHALGFDAQSGRRLWNVPGAWPQFVAGDVVLAQKGEPASRAPGSLAPKDGSAVVGLDANTGRTRWDASARYPASRVFSAIGGLAAIAVPSDSPGALRRIVLDARTGSEVADLGNGLNCWNDRRSLLVCDTERYGQFIVFDAGKRTTTRIEIADTSRLYAAWHGHLVLDDRVVDRDGKPVTDRLPGIVIAMSDDYVVLYDNDTSKYSVHRRTR
jgi:outer membrane protein assembly factor BamB